MTRTAKALSAAHRGALLYLSLATAPVMLAFLSLNTFSGAARLLEKAAPLFGWLVSAWFLCAAYFCGCLIFSADFRESLLTRISGFRERDEREEIVTAKASRAVFLVMLGVFVTGGLIGMIRMNVFNYVRWEGDRVPPLVKIGAHEIQRGVVAKHGFLLWPSIGIPHEQSAPRIAERTESNVEYYYEEGPLFPPEVSSTCFALAAIQVLLFHLFARRVRV